MSIKLERFIDLELKDFLLLFSDEKRCKAFFVEQRWGAHIICPYCYHNKVYILNGKYGDYKCAECRLRFNVKTNTMFHDSKLVLQKWFIAIFLLEVKKTGISTHKLAKLLEVTQKTSWIMVKKIKANYNNL